MGVNFYILDLVKNLSQLAAFHTTFHMSANTTNMGLFGGYIWPFWSLLNLWVIGEGFHAYLHSEKKAAICNIPSSWYDILGLQNSHPTEIAHFFSRLLDFVLCVPTSSHLNLECSCNFLKFHESITNMTIIFFAMSIT